MRPTTRPLVGDGWELPEPVRATDRQAAAPGAAGRRRPERLGVDRVRRDPARERLDDLLYRLALQLSE